MQEELREAGGKGGLEHLGKDMQKGEKRLDGERRDKATRARK